MCNYRIIMILFRNGAWRTKRSADWAILPETTEKSSTGYVGLKNLACICYMNSLLQQFYMIPSFRNDILAVKSPNKTANTDEDMLFQTQCLFSALYESVKQYYNPKIFCHAFKDWEGKSINVIEQMDVDEFFNLFLDKLEHEIKGTPQENSIKYHFGGIFANQIICKDCPHSSVREEPFLAINLQIKNKKSLQQCMESFVEGEMLQGNNAYYCEKCEKKVTSLKRVCIKKLPRYLICVLKRFDIDYDSMQKYKVNEYCEFPMHLNMETYTMEGLAKKDKEKEKEKAAKEGKDLDDIHQIPNLPNSQYPQEYYEYKLTGVVVHIGTADAGHYYSIIMDREKNWIPEKERWYEFNDIFVNNYDPDDIKNDAFGGEERLNGDARVTCKNKNAYLLVYERVTPYDTPENEERPEKSRRTLEETIIPEGIHRAIQAENEKYWYNKYMFHEDYFGFARLLCLSWNSREIIIHSYPSKNCDYALLGLNDDFKNKHGFQTFEESVMMRELLVKISPFPGDLDILIFKYGITVLFTTIFRAKNRMCAVDMIDISKAYINKHLDAAKWLLWQFANSRVVYEFLLECPVADICRFTVGLLYCAMLKVYESEKEKIAEWVPGKSSGCSLPLFANCIMCQLEGCRKLTKNFEYYFQAISRLAFLGPEMRDYFYRTGAITRLIGFWKSIPETNWNNFKKIEYTENKQVELGTSTDVDERFQSPFEEIYVHKREQIVQQAQPIYTFLFEALSLLIRGLDLNSESRYSPNSLPRTTNPIIVDPYLKNLLLDPKKLGELMSDCKNLLEIHVITQCLQYLSWENLEFKTAWLKAIIMQITEFDCYELRVPFSMLEALLSVEDKGQKSFLDTALTELDTALKLNIQYFFPTNCSIDNIICIANKNKAVFHWYTNNYSKWQWIIEWLKENSCLPSTDLSDPVKPHKSKDLNFKYFMQQISIDSQKEWRNRIEGQIRFLILMSEGILF